MISRTKKSLSDLFPLIRHLSCRLTPILLKTFLTPNQITLLSLLCGLLCAGCFSLGAHNLEVIGAFFLVASYTLDNCDGEVARIKNMSSEFGAKFDDMVDWMVDASFFVALGYGVSQVNEQAFWFWLGIIAALGAFIDYVVDLHSAAKGRSNMPQVRSYLSDAPSNIIAKAFGIEVILDAGVTSFDGQEITLKSQSDSNKVLVGNSSEHRGHYKLKEIKSIQSNTLIWTAGTTPIDLIKESLFKTSKGRILVNQFLQVPQFPEVFAIGDCALFVDPITNRPLPPTAQIAEAQAKLAAKNSNNMNEYKHDFPSLSHSQEGRVATYLDSASSSQKPSCVIDLMTQTQRTHYANIHRGLYTWSQETTRLYEGTRAKVASFIGGAANEIIFTKNATESINLIASSWAADNLTSEDEITAEIKRFDDWEWGYNLGGIVQNPNNPKHEVLQKLKVSHLFNGIRYLFWTYGYGMELKTVYTSGYIVLSLTFIASIFVWAI